MKQLEIRNIGPIKHVVLDVDDTGAIVLTGPQASGKSTIAKALYFFKSFKADIYDLLIKRANTSGYGLFNMLLRSQFDKFYRLFGFSDSLFAAGADESFIRYSFCNHSILIGRTKDRKSDDHSDIALMVPLHDGRFLANGAVSYSGIHKLEDDAGSGTVLLLEETLFHMLHSLSAAEAVDDEYARGMRCKLNEIFDDDSESIFIPAGRSVITVLCDQLNYIFTSMDEGQRSTIDYCTQKYVERILRLKPLFVNGLDGYRYIGMNKAEGLSFDVIDTASTLIDQILKGRYRNTGEGERLYIDNGSIRLNYASSGQQEAVWILNIIFYALYERNICLFLEEPESDLYPDSQMLMAKLLGVFVNSGKNSLVMTTHSPYVLGEINNLLYAGRMQDVPDIPIPDFMKFREGRTKAYFVSGGNADYAMDYGLIRNDLIDGASDTINEEFDKLIALNGGRV